MEIPCGKSFQNICVKWRKSEHPPSPAAGCSWACCTAGRGLWPLYLKGKGTEEARVSTLPPCQVTPIQLICTETEGWSYFSTFYEKWTLTSAVVTTASFPVCSKLLGGETEHFHQYPPAHHTYLLSLPLGFQPVSPIHTNKIKHWMRTAFSQENNTVNTYQKRNNLQPWLNRRLLLKRDCN